MHYKYHVKHLHDWQLRLVGFFLNGCALARRRSMLLTFNMYNRRAEGEGFYPTIYLPIFNSYYNNSDKVYTKLYSNTFTS